MVFLMASLTAYEVPDYFSELGNTTQPIEHPVENFPVPLELRENIYQYLLHPDEVRCEPEISNRVFTNWPTHIPENAAAHTYKYNTNILGVNSTIHDEATKYLYKHSTFVRVQLSSNMLRELCATGVPLVSKYQVQNFKQHSLAVLFRFFWPTSRSSTEYHNILMLTQDLPLLRDMMRLVASHLTPQVPYIISGPAVTVDQKPRGFKLELGLRCCATKYKLLSQVEQRTVLETFKTVTGAGYTMRILGFEDEKLAEITKQAMAPMVVWLVAQKWDRLQVLYTLKGRADRFALSGKLEAARSLYSLLLKWLLGPYLNSFTDRIMNTDDDLRLVRHLELNIKYEISISQGWLDYRAGHMEGLDQTLIALSLSDIGRLHPLYCFKCHLNTCRAIELFGPLSTQARATISSLLNLSNTHPQCHGDAYMQYDIALLRKARTELENTGVWNLPRGRLRAFILPARIFDSFSGGRYPTPKETLVRWQHKEQLRALTDAQKEQIVALHGQKGCEWAKKLAREGRRSFNDV